MPPSEAKTWVELSETNLRHNIHALKSRLREGTAFCAVVKANAYGHDLDHVVRVAYDAEIRHFATDSIDEAIRVRALAPESTIFILGYTVAARAHEIVRHRFVQTVYTTEALEQVTIAAKEQHSKAQISIKIETGTQRQGITPEKLQQFIMEVRRRDEYIKLVGLASHFCDAENMRDQSFTDTQLERFKQAESIVNDRGFTPRYVHIACSAPGIHKEDTHGTLVRFGISLYGLWSSKDVQDKVRIQDPSFTLKPVLAWKTTVAQVKDIPNATTIGYGRTYTTDRPIRIAVLAAGYFDGYRRAFSRNSEVLIRGQRCRVLGTICMNMFMVDVSTLPKISQGDTATLIGTDGIQTISAEDLAERIATINYEVTTMINPLLPRFLA